jgi:hypothetical protein
MKKAFRIIPVGFIVKHNAITIIVAKDHLTGSLTVLNTIYT